MTCATPTRDERARFSTAPRSPRWSFPMAIRALRRFARMHLMSASMVWACAPTASQLGCDCLGHIEYLDAHLCDSRGRRAHDPQRHLHSRRGLRHPLEAHRPSAARRPEVRRSRRLVISSISTVENYEYGFFWYFYQDGNIQFEIKLTGILSLGAVRPGERPPAWQR